MTEKLSLRRTGAVLAIGTGIFFLLSELIAACFSAAHAGAYIRNTISDLGVPYAQAAASSRLLSPLWALMDGALIVCGTAFAPCYMLCNGRHRNRLIFALTVVLATLTGAGIATVGLFHQSEIEGIIDVHSTGAFFCFTCGSILTLLTGMIYGKGKPRAYRVTALFLGLTGSLSTALVMFLNFGGHPDMMAIPERLTVYSLVVWHIVAGVFALKQ